MRSLLVTLLVLASISIGLGSTAAQEATPITGGSYAGLEYTNVRFFLPNTPDGLAPGLTVTEEMSGVCLELSLADVGRSDAWGCTDSMNNQHLDPCFENPFGPMDERDELICAQSPFSTEVVRFTLTEPLRRQKDVEPVDIVPAPPPAPDVDAPRKNRKGRRNRDAVAPEPPPVPVSDKAEEAIHPYDIPWGLELANGERCTLLTGATAVLADERINYSCENGGFILGEVDHSGPVWLVSYLAADAYASDLVPVAVAWT